jgi:hypothetical protein
VNGAPTQAPGPDLPAIGCNGRGVQDSSLHRPITLEEPSIEEQFRLVRATGAFDAFDRLPLPHEVDTFLRCMAETGLPVHTTSGVYELGGNFADLDRNLVNSAAVGAVTHNVMLYWRHADSRLVTDDEVIDAYLRAYDLGLARGVTPAFELHVNMWSEDPRRVTPVALAVRRRGIPFHLTLDYSHVLFKMGNAQELALFGLADDVAAGHVVLDPFEHGNLVDEWLSLGLVRWLQVRPAVPNGPRNVWAPHDPDAVVVGRPTHPTFPLQPGEPGRGILYPFSRPAPGEWHSPWEAWRLQPCKEVVRKVLRHHATTPDSPLRHITTEMIALPDYALHARFSLIGQNADVARWIRSEWNATTPHASMIH